MKKSILLLMIPSLLLVGCGQKDSQSEQVETIKPFDQSILAINNYDVLNHDGYDFALKQTYDGIETNYTKIKLRVKQTNNGIVGEKVTSFKRLNDASAEEQFTIGSETTYFNNGKIGELKNDAWSWSLFDKNTFFKCDISQFDFKKEYFTNFLEFNSNNEYSFNTNINANYVSNFFKNNLSNVKDVKVSAVFNNDATELKKLDINYKANLSNFQISLLTYEGDVTINLPN